MQGERALGTNRRINKIQPPLKWHGGKHYLADRIISLMPNHVHYVEPFFGGGAVLLAKDPDGISEVVNDIYGELTGFWKVLQNEEQFQRFKRILELTPFSQIEWKESFELCGDPTKDAVKFFIRCRQSRAGKLTNFATLSRNRTRRRMNEQVSSWLSAIEGLPQVANRLKRVVVLNDNALRVIKSQDSSNTLFYLDPPYLHETRVTTADYTFEMTYEQHKDLLDVLLSCQGKVMLSGYPNELYSQVLRDWRYVDFKIDNKSSSAKNKPIKTERLWLNY